MSSCEGVPPLEGVLGEEEDEEEATEEDRDDEAGSGDEEDCPELSALEENLSDDEESGCDVQQQHRKQDQHQHPRNTINSCREERTSSRGGIITKPTHSETSLNQLEEHGTIWNQPDQSRANWNQQEPFGTKCSNLEEPGTPNNNSQQRHDPSEVSEATHPGTHRKRSDDSGKTKSKASRKVKLLPSPRVGIALDDGQADLSPRAPSPSQIIWRPVMPGYTATTPSGPLSCGSGVPVVIHQRTIEVHRSVEQPDVGLKQAIPAMPMYLAIICLVFNIISPGLGTFVAGLSVLFCSRPRPRGTTRLTVISVNTWVAIVQLLSTAFLLIGWAWSIVWGLAFLVISKEYYYSSRGHSEDVAAKDDERQSDSSRTGGRATCTTTTTTKTTTREETTTTSTTHSLPYTPPDSIPHHSMENIPPIIILHEAPLSVQPPDLGLRPPTRLPSLQRPTTRRQRIAQRRQWSALNPGVLLSPETLEHIVIHSRIVPEADQVSNIEKAERDIRPSSQNR